MSLEFFNEPFVIGSQIAGVHALVQGGISQNFSLFLRFLSTCTSRYAHSIVRREA